MKKYIIQNGYKYKDGNDMSDKQFYRSNAAYAASEHSTLSNLVMDMQETYVLFLKSFTASTFRTKLESIINDANSDGVCATLDSSEVERQENGYLITMNFITRGD